MSRGPAGTGMPLSSDYGLSQPRQQPHSSGTGATGVPHLLSMESLHGRRALPSQHLLTPAPPPQAHDPSAQFLVRPPSAPTGAASGGWPTLVGTPTSHGAAFLAQQQQSCRAPLQVAPQITPIPVPVHPTYVSSHAAVGADSAHGPFIPHSRPSSHDTVTPVDRIATQIAGVLLSVSASRISASNRKERLTPPVVETFGQLIDMISEAVILGVYHHKRALVSLIEQETAVSQHDIVEQQRTTGAPPKRAPVSISDADIIRYLRQHFNAAVDTPEPESRNASV